MRGGVSGCPLCLPSDCRPSPVAFCGLPVVPGSTFTLSQSWPGFCDGHLLSFLTLALIGICTIHFIPSLYYFLLILFPFLGSRLSEAGLDFSSYLPSSDEGLPPLQRVVILITRLRCLYID
ncbi:hypothetical protein BU26DRAFT_254012 [Trematosphaeria pertusa]|uniref:Uncharacterized protein n=1 Tax=Trematosphaeria pertusa TaxID=390896 RepID=A0A6A6IR27_9PLEO|nr:uncharacterized protein BU26DRAFT_254012 [Trematosphaeria pertusa]KAF2252252.1 hypothetical protein BU26DRAFT_254012 [Trematosphaeria pertusa]